MPKQTFALFPYKDEREFEDEYIIPLLKRLGFPVIVRYHGTGEHGKDLIVAEVDRFGDYRYHGIQTKYDNIGSGHALESIIEDAKQAFRMPFQHPTSGEEARISTFYVLNGGRISSDARAQFFQALVPLYGSNVKLLSGENLKDLIPVDIPVLKGLIHEVEANHRKIDQFRNDPPEELRLFRLRQGSVATFLARPTIDDLVPLASQYMDSIDQFNSMLSYITELKGSATAFRAVMDDGTVLLDRLNELLTRRTL